MTGQAGIWFWQIVGYVRGGRDIELRAYVNRMLYAHYHPQRGEDAQGS